MARFWPFDFNKSKKENKTTDISNYTWSELLGQQNSHSGVSVNVDSALRVSTVLACARVLAEGVAQLPLKVYRIADSPLGQTRKEATDHPAFDLLYRRPNDWMTAFELREQMTIHAVLTGNAYAYLGWGGRPARIVEIIPLVVSRVTPIRGPDYSMTYRVSNIDGTTTVYPQENILHIRGPSWDGYLGLDSIQMAREAIGLAIATEETHASLHANGAQPGGILTVKGKLDDTARDRLKLQWQQFQGGVQNRFKTAVVDMDSGWTPMAMSGVDSQHIETRRFQIEEICRAMRVFPQMVMHSDKTSTFASAESFFTAHVTHSLMPWITRWEHTLEHALLDPKTEADLIIKFNVNGLLRGTPAERADFYLKALGGSREMTAWMTRNEVRALEDMDPIKGGEALPEPPIPAAGYAPTGGAKFNPNHGVGDDGRGGEFVSGGGGGSPTHSIGIHATDIPTATAVKKQWIAESPLNNVDQVYAGAANNKVALDLAGGMIAAKTDAEYKASSIKKLPRVLQKMAAGRTAAGVTDIVRSTFVAQTPAQADAIVAELGKHFALVDEGYKNTPVGYTDRAVNVRFANGQIGEVQIMPAAMAHAKSLSGGDGHGLYIKWRVLPPTSKEAMALADQQRAVYSAAKQTLSPDWKKAFGMST